MHSLFSLSIGQWVLFSLAWTQIVILLVTVYFHRAASHRAIELLPMVHRACRFLSWFMIAMVPREFAAVHRKHHATCDTDQDPHSPVRFGWKTVLFNGLALYRAEAANAKTLDKYGRGLPVDPWEGFYQRHKNMGIFLQLLFLVFCFGWAGLGTWVLLMLWIPFWAAGVINGLGHHVGYRRFATEDRSTNLLPWGLWVGGEELHNNHHAYPASAKFSKAWYEVDLGWGAICLMVWLGLARVRQVVVSAPSAMEPERAFLRLLRDRHQWQARLHACFDRDFGAELRSHGLKSWRQVAKWQDKAEAGKVRAQQKLQHALSHPTIAALHQFERDLARLWKNRFAPSQGPLAMEQWLHRAKSLPSPAVHTWCQQLSAQ